MSGYDEATFARVRAEAHERWADELVWDEDSVSLVDHMDATLGAARNDLQSLLSNVTLLNRDEAASILSGITDVMVLASQVMAAAAEQMSAQEEKRAA